MDGQAGARHSLVREHRRPPTRFLTAASIAIAAHAAPHAVAAPATTIPRDVLYSALHGEVEDVGADVLATAPGQLRVADTGRAAPRPRPRDPAVQQAARSAEPGRRVRVRYRGAPTGPAMTYEYRQRYRALVVTPEPAPPPDADVVVELLEGIIDIDGRALTPRAMAGARFETDQARFTITVDGQPAYDDLHVLRLEVEP